MNAWGKTFYTTPLVTRAGGDIFRVIAGYDNTQVLVNGVANATLQRGEIKTLSLTGANRITSDKPVYLAQYAQSSDADNVKFADPFMVMVPATRFFTTDHMVCTGPNAFTSHFINIVAPAGAVGTLTLDGAPIAAGDYAPIAATGFFYARKAVAPGQHSLSAAQPFSTIVYGFGPYESYAWPGGLIFGDTTPPTLECPPDFTVPLGSINSATGASSCRASVPDLRQQVKVTDNCLVPSERAVTQTPPPGTLVGVGAHEITLTAHDAAGNEASCVVVMTVIDPGVATIDCPKDILAPCTKGTGANVVFRVTAHTQCKTDVEVECNPPSGSFFPAGTTTVVCTTKQAAAQACSFKVTINCSANPNNVIVAPKPLAFTWAGDAVLESADNPAGPWTIVPGATPPFSPAATETSQFFRLREVRTSAAAASKSDVGLRLWLTE